MRPIFIPASGGNLAERLLRDRGWSRVFVAGFAKRQLTRAYAKLRAGCWKPPAPRMKSRYVISMTSWPPRFADLPLVLLTLVQQTMGAERIVLWLTEADRDILDPEIEKCFAPFGLQITTCDDLKSHKKWLPLIESGHANSFVICDDDIIYPREWLASLLNEARPDAFVGLRAHEVKLDGRYSIASYAQWTKQICGCKHPSPWVFVTGGGGAIVNPQRISERFMARSEILSKCPTADDVWLNAMHVASGILPFKTKYSYPCLELPGTHVCGLANENVGGGENDRQMANVAEFYANAGVDL